MVVAVGVVVVVAGVIDVVFVDVVVAIVVVVVAVVVDVGFAVVVVVAAVVVVVALVVVVVIVQIAVFLTNADRGLVTDTDCNVVRDTIWCQTNLSHIRAETPLLALPRCTAGRTAGERTWKHVDLPCSCNETKCLLLSLSLLTGADCRIVGDDIRC